MPKPDESQDNKINLVMVVNGTPHPMSFAKGQKINVIVAQTLKDTGNTGQPIENWELRDAAGNLLDLDKHLKDYGFEDGVQLFLNPKAGIGG